MAVNRSLMRAVRKAGLRCRKVILFIGDVGEEGKGALRGIRHLFIEGPYRSRIEAFFTVDGLEAVGALRYRVTFRGPGGHSYSGFGTVNPMHALAAVVTGLSRLETSEEARTTYNAAAIGGGTSINAIPDEVWLDVDLRSISQQELDRIDAAFHAVIEAAVADENAHGDTAHGAISAGTVRIGNRPAGANAPGSPFVAMVRDAVAAFSFPAFRGLLDRRERSDRAGHSGRPHRLGRNRGRAHSLDEWIDVEPELSLRGMNAVLLAILSAAGLEPED